MQTEDQAKALVEKTYPQLRAVDCFAFRDFYLVRVKHNEPEEEDYDPFFAVNLEAQTVNEFVIGEDAQPIEVAQAFRNRS